MPRWLRWTLIVLAVLVVIGAGLYYWLIVDNGRPGNLTAANFDIVRVRTLADEMPGPKADEIRVETIVTMTFPQTAVVAGEGWDALPMSVLSYQLVFPEGTIVIDTALDEAGAATLGGKVEAEAYARMNAAMGNADQIVITHEHPDHLGGVLAHPDPTGIAPRLRLTKEQLATAGRFAGFATPPNVLAAAVPLDYADYTAIAPGVVLIKAPGHSPGSQMIYVQRADGLEVLFIGDIGWSLRNVEEVRTRARLVSQFMLGEDRDAVLSQLLALNALMESEPEVVIVPGHDSAVTDALLEQGVFVEGFAP
jgi:glyoxylase-like metal-dependent hydrolase (beta-lactamase superfamily II)